MGIKAAVTLLLAFSLVACSDSYENQLWRFEKFVSAGKIGTGRDQWLIKHNFFGDLEKVALIFGFMDDQKFCEEVAEMYMKRYPADRYMCTSAN